MTRRHPAGCTNRVVPPRVLPPAASPSSPVVFSAPSCGVVPVPASASGAAAQAPSRWRCQPAASRPAGDRLPAVAAALAVVSPGSHASPPAPADSRCRVRHFPSLVPPGGLAGVSLLHARGRAFQTLPSQALPPQPLFGPSQPQPFLRLFLLFRPGSP